jgi:LCP family protein required for cell wall assembly
MILHLTADRKQAYLVSIPRDTWVSIDGWGKAKINAAFSYGGPSLYVSTIERFTGLRMDHLVIADWDGFKFLTDELGGVRVSTGSGTQLLDGEQALEYVRERETLPRGDLDRIQRQQNVLRELSQQVMSGGTLANPAKLTGIINVVADSLAVDKGFTAGEMRSLALSMRDIRSGDVTHVTIPVARFDRIDGQSVVIADRPGTRALFSAVLTDELDDYLATHDADTLPEPKNVS